MSSSLKSYSIVWMNQYGGTRHDSISKSWGNELNPRSKKKQEVHQEEPTYHWKNIVSYESAVNHGRWYELNEIDSTTTY